MKKGLILINAYSGQEQNLDQAERLKDEFSSLGVLIDIKSNNEFIAYLNNGLITSSIKYDFCIYLDKDKYISQMLEKLNIPLFNSHEAIQACDDKMTTSILLANNNIPMPKTLAGLLCYDVTKPINLNALKQVEKGLSYPLVIKTCYGSLGEGVYKIDDYNQLVDIATKLKCTPHLFQEFIQTSYGKDIRVILIGGKYVAAMLRESETDFRSNLQLGGKGSVYNPPIEVIELCEKVANILKLDYCGIDVLFGKDCYYICEVNSNAFFKGIEKVTKINIAKHYVDYIYKKIY